jgi:hypothetical protein
MFNRRTGHYRADYVVLVAVNTPRDYCCVVLPIDAAERAAQLDLDKSYRTPRKDGQPKKPNKVWIDLVPNPKELSQTTEMCREEREILQLYRDNWDLH